MGPSFEERDVQGPVTASASATAVREGFERRLRADGVMAALSFLNQRTRFRFTGLYRVTPPQLCNVSLFDRENPGLDACGSVWPLSDSLCSIVYASGNSLRIDDAYALPALRAHPARESVRSYTGVPVRHPDGRVAGTLCHYDGRLRITPAGELHVLELVAPLLLPWLRGGRKEALD